MKFLKLFISCYLLFQNWFLFSVNQEIAGNVINMPSSYFVPQTISLEFARSKYELSWGLMQRNFLPENQGMLFMYPKLEFQNFWAFNCLIDLSLAFMDSNGIIRQMGDLKAYPEKMDPSRTVTSVQAIASYPLNDPITKFFQARSLTSLWPIQYVLEVNKNWYKNKNINIGDKLIWDLSQAQGIILRSLDISGYKPTDASPILLTLPIDTPVAVWMPSVTVEYDIGFLSEDLKIIKTTTLQNNVAPNKKPVAFSMVSAKHILIATKDWSKKHLVNKTSIIENK